MRNPVAFLAGNGDASPPSQRTAKERVLGSAGKLNLLFRRPVRWKHGSTAADSDAAFRFLFAVDSLAAFEQVVHDTEEAEQEYAADDVADVIVRLLLYQKIFG